LGCVYPYDPNEFDEEAPAKNLARLFLFRIIP
jgi:hypothetical protein